MNWWSRLTSRVIPPREPFGGWECIADECHNNAVPPDGPFCERHNWSNYRKDAP